MTPTTSSIPALPDKSDADYARSLARRSGVAIPAKPAYELRSGNRHARRAFRAQWQAFRNAEARALRMVGA
jgi:hypothetical protein